MLIISNHASKYMDIPKDAVIRINLAWFKTREDAMEAMDACRNDIFLDYPRGRTKPPKPTITLEQAIELADSKKVRYFAVSNVEDGFMLAAIKSQLPAHIEIVPKIESVRGIDALADIVSKTGCKIAMLDKEDLYTDVDHDPWLFDFEIERVRQRAVVQGLKLLELQGVIFA